MISTFLNLVTVSTFSLRPTCYNLYLLNSNFQDSTLYIVPFCICLLQSDVMSVFILMENSCSKGIFVQRIMLSLQYTQVVKGLFLDAIVYQIEYCT